MCSNERMIEALAGLVSFTSVSVTGTKEYPYGEGVGNALEYMLKLCHDLRFETKNCNNRIGYAQIGEGEQLIGILVHLDVVPAGNDWDTDPFTLTKKDGKLFGRGVSDDKGPAIASVFAMKDILEECNTLNKRIRIIFGLSEEVGDWDDMEYYKQTEEIPDYGFTPDADFPAIYGEKGIAHFTITLPREDNGVIVSGGEATNVVPDRCTAVISLDGRKETVETTGKAAHGSTPECGENAISKLMDALSKRDDLKDSVIEFYNAVFGYDYNGVKLGCAYSDEQSGALTCNVGTVSTDENEYTFSIDIRYPVTCSLEFIQEKMNNTLNKYGASATLTSHMNPVYADKNGPVIKALIDAYREHTGDFENEPTVIGGGTYARAMDNITAFGPMIPGRELTEHMKNEYLLEEDMLLIRHIYFSALKNLLKL